VQSATVDGTIEVPQYIQPVLDTGFVDEAGNWKGIKSSDENFIGLKTAEGIANGGEVLFPDTANIVSIDMTGFSDLFIALKPSNGGNYAITAVMGPDTTPFANLTPVAAARTLRGADALDGSVENVLLDSAEDCQSDLWNIIIIKERLAEQKHMQFKIVNNSGGNSNIEFGFMRLV
jgi:hypothetical protein